MFDEFPIAAGSVARNERQQSYLPDSGIPTFVRQFFHPYVLAFLALALTVGGYGYGYKLSQYFQHSGVSKASPTRMWVEHRDEFAAVQAQHHVKPQRIPGLTLFAISAPRVPRLSRDHVVITPAPARVALFLFSHIPFRAPPSLHSSLA